MNIHFIEDDTTQLAYFGETARFFAINDFTKSLIQDLMLHQSEDHLLKQYDLDLATLQQFKNTLQAYAAPTTPIPELLSHKLKKLIFNISNSCNLRCKYCYANHGHYGTKDTLMTETIAKEALDRFYGQYDDIEFIQLFGGEPTLNLPVMEFICKYVTEKNKSLASPTALGFVTNGTLVTDELIQLINTYDLSVTVSYDGDPIVNDLVRVFPNEKGSSDLIIQNIKKLQTYTKQPNTIEVTYSQEHLNHGIKITDIMHHLRQLFGDITIHIVPATGDCHCSYALKDLSTFITSIDEIFTQENPDDYTYNLLHRSMHTLVTKTFEHNYICEAGIAILSISSTGDVFPCFTFTDQEAFYMGNVMDSNLFESTTFLGVQDKFLAFEKSKNNYCKDCFAKRICNACLGSHFLATNIPFTLNKANCIMEQKIAEKIILNVYKYLNKI